MQNPPSKHIIANLIIALRSTDNYLFGDITKLYTLRNKTSRALFTT